MFLYKGVESMREILNAIIGDENFQEMSYLLSRPNFFTIFGVEKSEKMHTCFIFWFLNPKSNHNLGSLPLELFFKLLKKKSGKPFVLENLNIPELEVSKEYDIGNHEGRLDIYAENEKLVLVIENKIEASETYNEKLRKYQTDVYFEQFEKEAVEKEKFYVYLRPFESNILRNENFICITYQNFFDAVIDKCIDYSNIDAETKNILEQYMLCLSSQSNHIAYTMRDLATKIYEKHEGRFNAFRSMMAKTERSKEVNLFLTNMVAV